MESNENKSLMNPEGISSCSDQQNNGQSSKMKWFKKNILLFSIITSVVLGTCLGFLLRHFFCFDEHDIKYFGFPGTIFLRLIKLFIMPLVAFRYFKFILFFISAKFSRNSKNEFGHDP